MYQTDNSKQYKALEKVYIDMIQLTPLSVSLKNTEKEDQNLISSCKEFYRFKKSMLEDMYENWEVYGLPTGELERYLNGRKVNGVKQSGKSEYKKVCKLLSDAYNADQSYSNFLYDIALNGVYQEGKLYIEKEVFKQIQMIYDGQLSKKKNLINMVIPYDTRLKAFERNGLTLHVHDDNIIISSETYPNMLLAMSQLAKSGNKVKTFGRFNFDNCEFRQIFKPYSPCYEDVVRTLLDERIKVSNHIHLYLEEKHIKPKCETYWKVNYKYKGTQLLQIATNGEDFRVRITLAYWWDESDLLNSRLEKLDTEIQRYCLRNLNYCVGCSISHKGGIAVILGKRKRLCGGIGIDINNPTVKELENIKRFIEIRCEIIDEVFNKK